MKHGLAALLLWSVIGVATAAPEFTAVRAAWQPSYAYLLDRNGEVLQAQRIDFKTLRLGWVPLSAVSPALVQAVLNAEDHRFRTHAGIDWLALAAAARDYLLRKPRRGASTITMQLASLLDPQRLAPKDRRRGFAGKWAQLRVARTLEAHWSKDQILEAYLNRVTFRGELQGIAAASAALFQKEPSGLTAAEAEVLASLLAAPNARPERIARRICLPARAKRDDETCKTRQDLVYATLNHAPTPPRMPQLAPQLARGLLTTAGRRSATALAAPLQRRVSEILTRQLLSLNNRNVRDAAAVVVDNASGEVLAYVGSAGPHSMARAVDGVRARRQAGSTLKPFLYGLALEHRYLTPVSLLEDTPLNLETATGLYIPQNYDRNFKGLVSVRTALASSLNIPAVRTLVLVGVEAFRDRLQAFGYSGITEDGEHYGYSLALGSAEVNLFEQANAYRTLANGGRWRALRLRPEPQAAAESIAVMTPAAAFLISDILSDGAGRALTFGLDSPLATPFWSAVKTGTSKDMRDNWGIGYSTRYTVAVWVGNFEGDAMHEVSGISGAAPAWLEIMQALHAGQLPPPPVPPPGVIAADVEFSPAIEPPRRAWFLAGTETSKLELLGVAASQARITSPPNGAVIALDPDIPREHQAVIFQSRGAAADSRFYLNGTSLGDGGQPQRWTPVLGVQHLVLRSANGQVRDSVRFVVRGAR